MRLYDNPHDRHVVFGLLLPIIPSRNSTLPFSTVYFFFFLTFVASNFSVFVQPSTIEFALIPCYLSSVRKPFSLPQPLLLWPLVNFMSFALDNFGIPLQIDQVACILIIRTQSLCGCRCRCRVPMNFFLSLFQVRKHKVIHTQYICCTISAQLPPLLSICQVSLYRLQRMLYMNMIYYPTL